VNRGAGSSGFLYRPMADRSDVVAVRIEDEGPEVGRMVLGPSPGRPTIVVPASTAASWKASTLARSSAAKATWTAEAGSPRKNRRSGLGAINGTPRFASRAPQMRSPIAASGVKVDGYAVGVLDQRGTEPKPRFVGICGPIRRKRLKQIRAQPDSKNASWLSEKS
jgi:hypothetical protein